MQWNPVAVTSFKWCAPHLVLGPQVLPHLGKEDGVLGQQTHTNPTQEYEQDRGGHVEATDGQGTLWLTVNQVWI